MMPTLWRSLTRDAVVTQFGAGGFLEFATILAPALVVAGLTCLLLWLFLSVSSRTYGFGPRLVAIPHPLEVRMALALPFVLAATFVFVAFLRRSLGYWGVAFMIVALGGVIRGALFVALLRKIKKYYEKGKDKAKSFFGDDGDDGSPRNDGRRVVPPAEQSTGRGGGVPSDRKQTDGGIGGLEKHVRKAVYKRLFKMQFHFYGTVFTFLAAAVVFAIVAYQLSNRILIAEYVLSTFFALAGSIYLIWKLSKLQVQKEDEDKLGPIPLTGVLLVLAGASVYQFPDVYVPGTDRLRPIVASLTSYPERVVDTLFTLPVFGFVTIVAGQIGFLIGVAIAGYYWRTNRSGEADH